MTNGYLTAELCIDPLGNVCLFLLRLLESTQLLR
jgi:hypothetical protein